MAYHILLIELQIFLLTGNCTTTGMESSNVAVGTSSVYSSQSLNPLVEVLRQQESTSMVLRFFPFFLFSFFFFFSFLSLTHL